METKRILTRNAIPDMVLAENVYDTNDFLILSKGTKLTNYSITRLKFYSITDISIYLTKEGDVVAEPVSISEEPDSIERYSEQIKHTPEFEKFSFAFDQASDSLKHTFLTLAKDPKQPLDPNELLNDTSKVLAQSRNGTHIFHMLHCMRNKDDITYAHSINVALICNVLGHWLKMPDSEIQILTLAGLLHDIGKLLVPTMLISKTSSLSNEEFKVIQNHTMDGYKLLVFQDLDERIKYATIMHHERCDGSGYPDRLTNKQIDEFSKIVAIADTYDAMTSSRVYRPPICPFEVIEIFQTEGLQKFDPRYLLTFLQGIVTSYANCTVRLSDGRIGNIVMIDAQHTTKPLIKVGTSFIDLSKERGLSIIELL